VRRTCDAENKVERVREWGIMIWKVSWSKQSNSERWRPDRNIRINTETVEHLKSLSMLLCVFLRHHVPPKRWCPSTKVRVHCVTF
jgi:hypothetical protein